MQLLQLPTPCLLPNVHPRCADGRWHQLVNETSTFLETSATAMITFALATGVNNGWLERSAYDAAIQKGWAAMAAQVQPDGTVNGICAGTGIMTSVAGELVPFSLVDGGFARRTAVVATYAAAVPSPARACRLQLAAHRLQLQPAGSGQCFPRCARLFPVLQ